MKALSQITSLPWMLLLALVVPGHAGEPPAAFSLEVTQEPMAWTVLYEGQKILVYSFAQEKFKPYVKELCTFSGHNILRDSPQDHLHHHGLMYGIVVNGLNFWEEVSG